MGGVETLEEKSQCPYDHTKLRPDSPDNKDLAAFDGDYGAPLIGNGAVFNRDNIKFCSDQFKAYGNVSKFSLGNQRILLCLGPEFNKAVLTDKNESFSARIGYDQSLGIYYPNGMLLREGKEHRITRRAALPSFTTAALADYVNSLNLIMQENIQLLPVGSKFSFYRFIQNTLFDVAAKIFVGLEPGTEKANNLNRLFAIVNAYFSVGDKMHFGLVFPGLRKLPFTIAGKAHSARQKLSELFIEEIKVKKLYVKPYTVENLSYGES